MSEITYNVGDRVIVKSTRFGVLDGGPDLGEGTVVEVYSNRGARTLVIRLVGHAGRFLRLDEQVSSVNP